MNSFSEAAFTTAAGHRFENDAVSSTARRQERLHGPYIMRARCVNE